MQYTAEMKQQVHVFTELPAVPALIWLAHPRHAAQAEALKGLLLRFGQSSEGQQFFAQSGYRSMRPLRGDELLQLDRPAREASHLLKGAR
jgi:hypothetical protein